MMHSDSAFEDRVATALRMYADEAVQPFDADEIVERAVGSPRRPLRFGMLPRSSVPVTLIAMLLLLVALTIAVMALAAPEELRPVPHEPSDLPLGFIVSGESGVTIVDAEESFTLVSDEFHERIAWAYPDRRGGIIYQHDVTPDPWPQGAVMWLRAGATEPLLLAPPAQEATLHAPPIAPIGTVISGSGRAQFIFVATERPAVEGERYLSRLMAADLDASGEHRELTAWREDGSFDGRYGVVAGGSVVALIHHMTRHDTSGQVCSRVTLLSVDDGSRVPSSGECLEGAWRRWVTALGHDDRTLAGWDEDASRFVAGDLLTGEIVEDTVIRVPPSTFWGRPVSSPRTWFVLLRRETEVLLLDLAGREAWRRVIPLGSDWWTIPYFDPIRVDEEAGLGSGSGTLPCQLSWSELPDQELPPPVAATRQLLFDLAASCDYRGLARLAGDHRTVLAADDGRGATADRTAAALVAAWVRHALAGPEPLGLLAELLGAEPMYVAESRSLTLAHGDIPASDVWIWRGGAHWTQGDLVVISSDGKWRSYLP
jgi:hypothetical protein